MHLISQGNEQRCMLYSLAMALSVEVNYLAEKIGYAGDESFFMTPGDRQRSHHPQECIDTALDHGYAMIKIEPNPHHGNGSGEVEPIWNQTTCEVRLQTYLLKYDGLVHMSTDSGALHMCAWCKDDQLVYDPNGTKYPIDDIKLIVFYALVKVM